MAQLKDLIVTGASRFVGGIFGNLTGNADSATKLLNARNIQINLSSTSAASFNGTANITPGVTNILAIGNGGTGATSASSALSNLGGVPLAGGTMTGALNFKNNTWNNVGDDAAIGDFNQVGKFCIKGLSGATGIYFAPYSGSTAQTITINGSGTMTISGTVSGTFSGSLSGNASSSSWLNTNSSLTYGASGFQYFNLNGTQGTIANSNNTPTSAWYHIMRLNHANSNGYFADIAVPLNDTAGVWWRQIRSGTNYGWFKILDSNNYTEYTVTKTGTGASGTWGISITGNAATASKLGTSTIGSSTKPIYLNGGTATASSSSIGDSLTPVYLNAGTITQGETFSNRIYDYNASRVYYYNFGGGQDLNWKKVFAASHSSSPPSSSDYRGCTVKGTIYHIKGNYNQAEVSEYPFQMNMSFYSGTTVMNACALRVSAGCPDTIIRAVIVTTNSFELQVRQPSDWERIAIQFSYNGNASTMSAFSPVNTTNTTVIAFSRLTTSRYISDSGNGTPITLNYSSSGLSSTSWLAGWNNYELRAISPSNVTAGKATVLAAARAINGTNFDGSAAITTANWGTARTLTIGNTGKSVNGSGNITWSLSEIAGNNYFCFAKPNISGSKTMNDAATFYNSMGMIDLSNPSSGTASYVNPNGQTGWHHFINMSYSDGGAGSNSWITQIANKAGTTDLWIRSRGGGTISNSSAWVAPWTRILTGTNWTNVISLGTISGTLSVAKGGTGSTSASGARTNLGIIVSATEPSSPANGTIWLELIS